MQNSNLLQAAPFCLWSRTKNKYSLQNKEDNWCWTASHMKRLNFLKLCCISILRTVQSCIISEQVSTWLAHWVLGGQRLFWMLLCKVFLFVFKSLLFRTVLYKGLKHYKTTVLHIQSLHLPLYTHPRHIRNRKKFTLFLLPTACATGHVTYKS